MSERTRIRDFNEALNELGRVVNNLNPSKTKACTKLAILESAEDIMNLENLNPEGDTLVPEVRAAKDKEQRFSNNMSQRMSIRDFNEALNELGRAVNNLNPPNAKIDLNARPCTKLAILDSAMYISMNLEKKVHEKNLNPTALCSPGGYGFASVSSVSSASSPPPNYSKMSKIRKNGTNHGSKGYVYIEMCDEWHIEDNTAQIREATEAISGTIGMCIGFLIFILIVLLAYALIYSYELLFDM